MAVAYGSSAPHAILLEVYGVAIPAHVLIAIYAIIALMLLQGLLNLLFGPTVGNAVVASLHRNITDRLGTFELFILPILIARMAAIDAAGGLSRKIRDFKWLQALH